MRPRFTLFVLGLALLCIAATLVSATGGSNLALIIGGLGVLCMLSVRMIGPPRE